MCETHCHSTYTCVIDRWQFLCRTKNHLSKFILRLLSQVRSQVAVASPPVFSKPWLSVRAHNTELCLYVSLLHTLHTHANNTYRVLWSIWSHIHPWTHSPTYTPTYVHLHTYTPTYINIAYVHLRMHIHTYVHVCTYIHTPTYTHLRTYTHTYVLYVHTSACECTSQRLESLHTEVHIAVESGGILSQKMETPVLSGGASTHMHCKNTGYVVLRICICHNIRTWCKLECDSVIYHE